MFTRRPFLVTACVCCLLMSASLSQGQSPILTYDFTGAAGNQVSTTGTTATGFSSTALTRGPGVTAVTGAGSINSNGWNSASFDSQDYYVFSVTNSSGSSINFGNLSIGYRRSSSGPLNFDLRVSTDGFNTNQTSVVTFTETASNTSTTTKVIPLSDLNPFNNSAVLEFRLYAWGASSAGGTLRLENYGPGAGTPGVSLTPVPEPATVLGLAAAGLITARFVRRRLTPSPRGSACPG